MKQLAHIQRLTDIGKHDGTLAFGGKRYGEKVISSIPHRCMLRN